MNSPSRRGVRRNGGLPFAPSDEVAGRPHVMADGAPTASTVLTLSHWPGSPTPPALRHDLSAGIAFRWLRSRRRWAARTPEVVCTDHFDQDGLVSVFAISRPEDAFALEAELMALAEAGDFARGTVRPALRASFALSAWAETWLSSAGRGPVLPGDLIREGLLRLPDLLQETARWRPDWEEEDAFLSRSQARLSSGAIELEEVDDADLAVIRLTDPTWTPASQLGRRRPAAVHPVAVHNLTRRSRILVLAPPRYELYFRYETWVELASSAWTSRRDLSRTAAELTAAEPGSARWVFNGVGATVARLNLGDGPPSDLAPEIVRRAVLAGLLET